MTYSAALDCKAAQFQGKKKGRRFWSNCKKQSAVMTYHILKNLLNPYLKKSAAIWICLKKIVSLTSLKKYSFWSKIAREWASQTPFCSRLQLCLRPWFWCFSRSKGTSSLWRITELCKTTDNSYQVFNGEHLHTNDSQFHSRTSHLHLLSN